MIINSWKIDYLEFLFEKMPKNLVLKKKNERTIFFAYYSFENTSKYLFHKN